MNISATETWKAFDQNPLTHSAAHYLMTIHEIQADQGYVRSTDVAHRLNISRGSCSIAVKSLKTKGLVVEDTHKMLSLTEQGLLLAQIVQKNDVLLKSLFHELLGVSEDVAEVDACKIEHLLSLETSIKLCHFVQFLESGHESVKPFVEALKKAQHEATHDTERCDACDQQCLFTKVAKAS